MTLAGSTAIGISLLVGGSLLDPGRAASSGFARHSHGRAVLLRDRRLKLVPSHFAERHGSIMIIALGESIVALGGRGNDPDLGRCAAAVGIAIKAMQVLYFDVVALVSARRLARAPEGKERNELARTIFLPPLPDGRWGHLFALGLKKTSRSPTMPSRSSRTSPSSAAWPRTFALVAFRRHVHRSTGGASPWRSSWSR